MKKDFFKKGLVSYIITILLVTSIATIVESKILESKNQNNYLANNNDIRNIMITGFWNPTGQMIAQFSTNPELNPDGWKGENWGDLGFNIYSFFPKPGSYTGDFEVDYQDTWEDFWTITDEIKPIAIISFGAGAGPWEIEYNSLNLDSWVGDDNTPFKPTPNPPDDTVPANYIRHSTLPVQDIEDAVNQQTSIEAWVDWEGTPGRYLCNYMAYLGMWYQSLHNTTEGEYPCRVAGFIHVNADVNVEDATEAAEITIRETIAYLNEINLPPNPPMIDGPTEGKTGEEYEYTISCSEPDADSVYYWIEWFDGDTGATWEGPFKSGDNIVRSHIWDTEGTYTISVKAKDSYDAESELTQLEVSMPRNKQKNMFSLMSFIEHFFNLFLKNIQI